MAYLNLLENFKKLKKLKAIFYASSSSVYGNDTANSSNASPKPISVYNLNLVWSYYQVHIYHFTK